VGVDLEKLIYVLGHSWGSSRMLERNAPNIIAGNFGPSAAPIRNLHKDLSIIREMAKENGLDLPALAEAERIYGRLLDENKGDWDITAATCLLSGDGGPVSGN
jgi:3-hydroxyisobutyrate dehydrogenase-like beta-hydroxyacid dehydrogenase